MISSYFILIFEIYRKLLHISPVQNKKVSINQILNAVFRSDNSIKTVDLLKNDTQFFAFIISIGYKN